MRKALKLSKTFFYHQHFHWIQGHVALTRNLKEIVILVDL